MEETNIHNGDNSTIVSNNEKNIIPIEVVPEFEPTTLIVANPRNGKFSKLGNWVKKWREVTIQKFRANYAKRNVITNVILTLYFLMSIVMTILYLFVSFAVTLGEPFIFGIFISAFLIPHILFLLHAYQFVILNWKEAVYKSYVSLFFSLIPYTMMYIVLNVPEPEEGASEGGDIVASAIMALFIILFVVGIVSIALRFKKYGASAKMLLDIPRDKSRKMFNYKTFLSVLAFCVCFLSLPFIIYYSRIVINNIQSYDPNFKPAKKAEVGDYYYDDDTASAELRTEKKCIGVVYSLELTEHEKKLGYKHGHIIALNDDEITQWASDLKDAEYFPNYTWENRRDALKDRKGLEYYYLRQDYEQIVPELYSYIFNVDKYSSNRSEWYVPTAGEWAEILKNLGGVEVNDMLTFNAETAAQNLHKYNIDEKKWYWTATEQDESNAWSIRIKNGEFGSRTPKNNAAYIRLVAAF